ncbi:MAG: hypothetical protein WBF55_11380, partial [Syntrophobacteria bacterium]
VQNRFQPHSNRVHIPGRYFHNNIRPSITLVELRALEASSCEELNRHFAFLNTHSEIPNPKHQITNKSQIPIFNDQNVFGILSL